jgi:hypothetical protein
MNSAANSAHDPDPKGRVAQSGNRFSDQIMRKQKS